MKVGNLLQVLLLLFLYVSFNTRRVYCRRAVIPEPDITNVNGNSAEFAAHDRARLPPCLLDIQKDLPKTNVGQPIYLVPNKAKFWLPNNDGLIDVPFGATIELYCSNGFSNSTEGNLQTVPKNTNTIYLSCYNKATFLWNGDKFEFKDFNCLQPPKYLVQDTGINCYNNEALIYRVGFNVTQGRFLKTMEICHDAEELRTHYTQHQLVPANLYHQRFVKRIQFSKAGFFRKHDMKFLYSQKNQKHMAEDLLKADHEKYFDNSTLFLSRGHLAAKSDQIYANQQRSTFTFFNAAPQWQSFNGGQWAQLENEVRKFVHYSNIEVDCYTGTWGTLRLSQGTGEKYPFYLSYDENNNGILPVPKLFYRVIVNRMQPTSGIALIGVNNPHTSLKEIHEEYIICKDIKNEIPWLKWIQNNNLKKGYLYACTVGEFMQVVKHLPKQLDTVKDVLM